MSESHLSFGGMVQDSACRERQDTGRRDHFRPGENRRAVMQRRAWIKNLQKQFGRNLRIHAHAGSNVFIEIIQSLQDDQRAMLTCR